jgi:hypothetical protein
MILSLTLCSPLPATEVRDAVANSVPPI